MLLGLMTNGKMEEDAVNSHSVSEISIQKVKWPDIQTGA